MTDSSTQTALDALDWHWGDGYNVDYIGGWWLAERLDNHRILRATDPKALRDLIIEDYSRKPVPLTSHRPVTLRRMVGAVISDAVSATGVPENVAWPRHIFGPGAEPSA